MTAIRYYQDHFYCRRLTATVTAVNPVKGGMSVCTDRTIFFPTGGGQPCDLGTFTREGLPPVQIMDVRESGEDNEVLHIVDEECPLRPGDTVTMDLDWDRRFENSQRHSGEHILSGAIYKVCGGANKGFHMGESYITIDIDLNGERMTDGMLKESEDLANQAIWQDLDGYVVWCKDKYEASKLPTRKKVTQEGRISMVFFGPQEDPFDCCACCGTHVRHTGEIGLIKIYKTEWNKGMNRIYFDCGRRALAQVQEDMNVLRQIEERFSAGTGDLLPKLDKKDEKETELRADLSKLVQYHRDIESARILSTLSEQQVRFYSDHFSVVSADDIVKLGFNVIQEYEGDVLLALVHDPSHTVLLFSKGTPACGNIVKEIAKSMGGKGGGRPDNARALFKDSDSAIKFTEELSTRFSTML